MVTVLDDDPFTGPPLPSPPSVQQRKRLARKSQRLTPSLQLPHMTVDKADSGSERTETATPSPITAFSFLHKKSKNSTQQNDLGPSSNLPETIEATRPTGVHDTRPIQSAQLFQMEPPNVSTFHLGRRPSSARKPYPCGSSSIDPSSASSSLPAAGYGYHHPHAPQQPPPVPPPAGYAWVLVSTPGTEHSLAQNEQITGVASAYGTLPAGRSRILERSCPSGCCYPEHMQEEKERRQHQQGESSIQDPGRKRSMNDEQEERRTTQQNRKKKQESQAQRAPMTTTHNDWNPDNSTSMPCNDNDDYGSQATVAPSSICSKQHTTFPAASWPFSPQQGSLGVIPTTNTASPYVVIVERHYHQYHPFEPVQGIVPASISLTAIGSTTANTAPAPYQSPSSWYCRGRTGGLDDGNGTYHNTSTSYVATAQPPRPSDSLSRASHQPHVPSTCLVNDGPCATAAAPASIEPSVTETFGLAPMHTFGPEHHHGPQGTKPPPPPSSPPPRDKELSQFHHQQHCRVSNQHFYQRVNEKNHGQQQNPGSHQHHLHSKEKVFSFVAIDMSHADSSERREHINTDERRDAALRLPSVSKGSLSCDGTSLSSSSLHCGKSKPSARATTAAPSPFPRILDQSPSAQSQPTETRHDTEIITFDDGEEDDEKDEGKVLPGGSKTVESQVQRQQVKAVRKGKDNFGLSADDQQLPHESAAAQAIAVALTRKKKKAATRNKSDDNINTKNCHDIQDAMRILLEKHERNSKGCIQSRRPERGVSTILASKPSEKNNALIFDVTNEDVLTGVRRGKYQDHPGNREFQSLVREYHDFYIEAQTNVEKAVVSNFLVEAVYKRGGRFLQRHDCERDLTEGVSYVELTSEEARQKTRDMLIRLCKGKR